MSENPYAPPAVSSQSGAGGKPWRVLRLLGTVVLSVGLLALGYGAVACFVIPLPPNGGASGRLPSIYIMGLGIVLTVVGLAVRDLRLRAASNGARKGIPPVVGIMVLLAILLGLFLAVACM